MFKAKSGGEGSVGYAASAAGVQGLKLTQITTGSTVFEVNAGGGSGPVGDYATQAWVQDQLTAYATTEDLTGSVQEGDLTAYATKEYVEQETSATADASALTAYATTEYVGQQVSAKADTSSLTAYVGGGAEGQAPAVRTIKSVYETDWQTLSASPDANTFYVVLADPE